MIKFIFTALILITPFAKANINQKPDMICQSKSFTNSLDLRFYHISRDDWKVRIWSITSPYLDKTLDVKFKSSAAYGVNRSTFYDKNNTFSLHQAVFEEKLNREEWNLRINLNEDKLVKINQVMLCQY